TEAARRSGPEVLGKLRILWMLKAPGTQFRLLREDPVYEPVLDLVRVGQDVAFVEANNLAEIVDARLVPINGVRFNRVFDHATKGLAFENPRECRRADLEGSVYNVAIDGVIDRDTDHARRGSWLQALGIIGFSNADLRTERPAVEELGPRDIRRGVN